MRLAVTLLLLFVMWGCSSPAVPGSGSHKRAEPQARVERRGADSGAMHLAKVNACAEAFGIEVRHTVGEGFRAWGDINRMQDLVDAPCGRLITPTMHRDFGRQFESLDAWVVQCLRDRGIGVDIDGPGGGFTVDEDAPTELVDQCLNQAYEQFRTPPPQAAG